jgi:protein-S-isoprenylcysteine O-methyltransferase Ste14
MELAAREPTSVRDGMRTPRAAAIAGIVFSCLFVTSLVLMWISISENPLGPATDVVHHSKLISVALNLLLFAGIAFLWFIAMLRDRRWSSACGYS